MPGLASSARKSRPRVSSEDFSRDQLNIVATFNLNYYYRDPQPIELEHYETPRK